MRAYHRVDPLMDERKSHYTPAQLGAFLKVQLLAGRQSHRGRFRSLDALRGAMPASYLKHLSFLVAEGDLVVTDAGVYVDGWDEWQEGDITVAERMARLGSQVRVLVVLADGMTRGSVDALRAVVADVEATGTTVLGIGIGDDTVENAYHRSQVVEAPDQLAAAMVEGTRAALRRSLALHGMDTWWARSSRKEAS